MKTKYIQLSILILLLTSSCSNRFQSEKVRITSKINKSDNLIIQSITDSAFKYETSWVSKNIDEIKALEHALEIDSIDCNSIIMGNPQYKIVLSQGDSTIELIEWYNKEVQFTISKCIVRLFAPDRVMEFLKYRGAKNINEFVQNEENELKQNSDSWERWTNAIPSPLKQLWRKEYRNTIVDASIDTYYLVLKSSKLSTNEQVLSVLYWLGSGEGAWSGFPEYETVAERLIMKYSLDEISKAISTNEVGKIQSIGLARYICGWYFYKERSYADHLIPVSILDELQNSKELISIEDNKQRFNRSMHRIMGSNESWSLWVKSVPSAIKEAYVNTFSTEPVIKIDTSKFENLITSSKDSDSNMILELLNWNGSYNGLWRGAPDYVDIPEDLLMKFNNTSLHNAITSRELSSQEIKGLTKFIGGWKLKKRRGTFSESFITDLRRYENLIQDEENKEDFRHGMNRIK